MTRTPPSGGRLPGADRLAEAEVGAVGDGRVDVGDDRALGEEEAAVRLPDDARVRLEPRVGGVSATQLLGREDLVRQIVQLGGLRALRGRSARPPGRPRASRS